ncbi:hypothetical protein TBLA_0D03020 [Henningerozyma blattae CBS 6284]|uniref:MHD domain-containing protein n=1 Tax=Henningerozyma blattae (strain ATCC 34711 / CBS 6284 / DSM 70876 / NBRC 10599 / NRRL Y-10934 / UCD 77-7) TaxID=1071380 RepID=I2H350_HENB6|nr:hypothetical protein TBLA_0D03020 [Tetrapisispora blattae CBS 6284]CCH60802.1 hypothetical protein TBLA_0D03020 [Tetrapisispora blattae CBS 6284]
MDPVQERNKYANTILVDKEPYESTEAIRIRLSQAKLINKNFYLLFSEISKLKHNYVKNLNRIISNNEDLNEILKKQMIESKVLEPEEMLQFDFNSLGELNSLWKLLINELKIESQSNYNFYQTIDSNIIHSLKDSTENDNKWNESRKLHSKLSKIAASIEMYSKNNPGDGSLEQSTKEWASNGPYLFELFETIDYNRLEILKNVLLNYQTGYSDYLLANTKNCETNMTKFLEFNPELEIDRFANDANNYTFLFNSTHNESIDLISQTSTSPSKVNTKSPQKDKSKRKSAFGALDKKFTSTFSSSNSNSNSSQDLMNNEFSNSVNNLSLKSRKSSGGLKSKVGSIFGRNKNRGKKLDYESEPIPDTDLSTRTIQSQSQYQYQNNINRVTSAAGSVSTSSSGNRRVNTDRKSTVERRSNIIENKPALSETKSNILENEPTESKPISTDNKPTLTDHSSTNNTIPRSESPVRKMKERTSSQSLYQTSHTIQNYMAANNNSNNNSNNNNNNNNNNINNTNNFTGTTENIENPTLSISQAPLQPNKSHSNSRDNTPPNVPSARKTLNPNRPSWIMPQMTGELKMLAPQATGSSSVITGQSLFQHSTLANSMIGLNASVAEVVNATFKEGVLTGCQLIGEIALSYINNDGGIIPVSINMKIDGINNFEKLILNPNFIERTGSDESEEFRVVPSLIDSKTLGAIKFSQKNAVAPIIIHPIWRFEPHQASVVLTIKLSPNLPASVNQLVLEDFVVFVTMDGANATSALSKPQGSFSKEKRRITWRFREPMVLKRGEEERMIARFMTDGIGRESERGISTKFSIKDSVTDSNNIRLSYQAIDENDPFGSNWKDVHTTKTLVAGNYFGLS